MSQQVTHTFYQQGGYVLNLLALKQQRDLHWQLDLKLRAQRVHKIVVLNEKNSTTIKPIHIPINWQRTLPRSKSNTIAHNFVARPGSSQHRLFMLKLL